MRFDLVYLDPPYGVGATMTARLEAGQGRGARHATSGPEAYQDRDDPDALAAMLSPRLGAIRDRMTEGATLYLHLDHRAVHEPRSPPTGSSAAGPSSGRSCGRRATARGGRAASR